MGACREAVVTAYLIIKWIHVLSSVVLVGTGFGSAYFMFFANRSGEVAAQAVVSRLVVRADWWFTTPTVVLQPATGLVLVHLAGWPWSTPWLATALALFALAGACWLPVVWLQIQMARMAAEAARTTPLYPPRTRPTRAGGSFSAVRPSPRCWSCSG
jgi:uncharacterized membrane protein